MNMEEHDIYLDLIKKRGLKYADAAGEIWRSRFNKFMVQWCELNRQSNIDPFFYFFHEARLSHVMAQLDDRLRLLGRAFAILKAEERLARHKLDTTMIIIRCYRCRFKLKSSYIPNHNLSFIVVPFKDYVPGEHRCQECAGPLETAEEYAMKEELRKMRIHIV